MLNIMTINGGCVNYHEKKSPGIPAGVTHARVEVRTYKNDDTNDEHFNLVLIRQQASVIPKLRAIAARGRLSRNPFIFQGITGRKSLIWLVGPAGLEPATNGL